MIAFPPKDFGTASGKEEVIEAGKPGLNTELIF
jgi:hypothetical protein